MQGSRRLVVRGAYRVRQFWHAVSAGPLSDQGRREIAGVLTDEQMSLFLTQNQAGQQHGYRVMKILEEAGHDQRDLLVAALLHDVGKYRMRYTWLDRVKVVLTQRIRPELGERWGQRSPNLWTRAFVVKAAHPAWGAESLAAAGGTELSVALVRRHQETAPVRGANDEENQLLALLQCADDQS